MWEHIKIDNEILAKDANSKSISIGAYLVQMGALFDWINEVCSNGSCQTKVPHDWLEVNTDMAIKYLKSLGYCVTVIETGVIIDWRGA